MKRLVIALLTVLVMAGCDQLYDTNPFRADMSFSLSQGFRRIVDGSLTMAVFQKGTGTHSYNDAVPTMTFDATSDPGLNDDTPTYSFSKDGKRAGRHPPISSVRPPLEWRCAIR